MPVKLSKSTLKNAETLHAEIANAVRGTGRSTPATLKQKLGASRTAELKKQGREIMSAALSTDARGTPKHPADKAAVAVILKNAASVRSDIGKLLQTKKEATPADYYEIYHKVMADSALLPTVDPSVIHKAFSDPTVMKVDCGACTLCNACYACSGCTLSVIEGTVAAGVAGATVSYFT